MLQTIKNRNILPSADFKFLCLSSLHFCIGLLVSEPLLRSELQGDIRQTKKNDSFKLLIMSLRFKISFYLYNTKLSHFTCLMNQAQIIYLLELVMLQVNTKIFRAIFFWHFGINFSNSAKWTHLRETSLMHNKMTWTFTYFRSWKTWWIANDRISWWPLRNPTLKKNKSCTISIFPLIFVLFQLCTISSYRKSNKECLKQIC